MSVGFLGLAGMGAVIIIVVVIGVVLALNNR